MLPQATIFHILSTWRTSLWSLTLTQTTLESLMMLFLILIVILTNQLFTLSDLKDVMQVAFEFGKYLRSLPSKSSTASQACKFVYQSYPPARETLSRHGKLRGLLKVCPYLQLDGSPSGGTYILSLNQEMFENLRPL